MYPRIRIHTKMSWIRNHALDDVQIIVSAAVFLSVVIVWMISWSVLQQLLHEQRVLCHSLYRLQQVEREWHALQITTINAG